MPDLNSENIIFLEENKEISQKITKRERVKFKCKICGIETSLIFKCFEKNPFLCKSCKTKTTLKNKYGTESFFNSKEFLKKRSETMLKKFGALYSGQIPKLCEKAKQTKIKKHGSLENAEKERIKKQKKTCLKKYGVESTNSLKEVKQKQQSSKKKKYKNGNYNLEKLRKNSLKKRGFESPNSDPLVKEKQRNSKKIKYGNPYGPTSTRVFYEGLNFDSLWEVYFYIYHKEKGSKIQREPFFLNYFVKGVSHRYYPDFKINGQLFEIKGTQFFNEKDQFVEFGKKEPDEKSKAKWDCMLKNNVKILKEKDILFYKKFAEDLKGKDFFKNLRKEQPNENNF